MMIEQLLHEKRLEALFGRCVEIVTAQALRSKLRESVLRDARPL